MNMLRIKVEKTKQSDDFLWVQGFLVITGEPTDTILFGDYVKYEGGGEQGSYCTLLRRDESSNIWVPEIYDYFGADQNHDYTSQLNEDQLKLAQERFSACSKERWNWTFGRILRYLDGF